MFGRVAWLDIAKFIGIFCIYLGHFADAAGLAYPFVFRFHVPLFFFLSGCAESLTADLPFKQYLVKNAKRILIPFFFFAFISLVVRCLIVDQLYEFKESVLCILHGNIRNTYFASGLWFLTCLFVMKILFYCIRRLAKKPWLTLLCCLCLFAISNLLHFDSDPSWVYNADSALYYIIYYAIGYYGFIWLKKLLQMDHIYKKLSSGLGFLCAAAYAAAVFFKKDPLSVWMENPLMKPICTLISTLILIGFIVGIAKLLEDVTFFRHIGQNTLYLCGSEYTIKKCVPLCIQLIGCKLTFINPVSVYIYTLILLVICHYTLVPIEQRILKKWTS